ncbi:DUF3173 domain-containing protein [Carnobacterium divergens]|uniref:DUF3173 domain-containing protein n=1 Tax=Carnobacterium divergens TaxID=2748 RepID=UPI0010722635|nr:DUF3173 domain-containing protein [Carnobacterium divergens]TFI65715.1 DUF3173 domain-containing protein [Carnobacterium divergens]TFI65820.1 DUF3173 domain-containing protein [Carnobacterium divergens]TFI80670.1 DUF3173 domain-containing protein [Carnobacterium divergens]TFI90735.1 DUF3173 domain-containing protein [Carnobacterium divergens]TFJ06620.1 DUF3173 domain-containing protein [Carnobacterium divergens]
MKNTISSKDLEFLGFKHHQAVTIIRQAKIIMVNKGYPYYNNKRIGVVPRHIVEEIIGIPLNQEE